MTANATAPGGESFLTSRGAPRAIRKRLSASHVLGAALLLLPLLAARASAQTATTAGAFSVEPPTLLSLGFDWKIAGDDNRNASVEVSYRKKGENTWRKGLPLLRLQR